MVILQLVHDDGTLLGPEEVLELLVLLVDDVLLDYERSGFVVLIIIQSGE